MTNSIRGHRRCKAVLTVTAPCIRLCLLPDAPDADGLPRVALEVPAGLGADHRPKRLLFPSMAAALAVKRSMEG